EKPDVYDRSCELDMPHPLAPYARMRHLDAAAVADHSLVFHPAVLAAGTFPVFFRPEDPLAEQAVFLGTVSPIIDCFRLLHLPERPASDVIRARQPDLDRTIVVYSIVRTFAHAHETLSSAGVRSCRSQLFRWVKAAVCLIRRLRGDHPGVSSIHR